MTTKAQKRPSMSGLKERLGGEGKIQWETTKLPPSNSDKSKLLSIEYWIDPPFAILMAYTIIASVIAEYLYNFGSLTLIVSVILSGLYNIRSRPHDNIPMGDGYLPFFGHTLNIIKHWSDFFDAEYEQFYNLYYNSEHQSSTNNPPKCYYSTSLPLGKNFIFLCDPKLIDLIFRLKFGDAEKGDESRTNLKPMLGHGIFLSDGARWKKQRSIASRMFTVRSLRDYMFEVFVDTSNTFIDKCLEIQSEYNEIDIYDMFNRLTLEAFTEVAFGVSLNIMKVAPKEIPFANSFDRGFQICTFRFFDVTWPIKAWLNIGMERELHEHTAVIEQQISEVVHQRRQYFNRINDKQKENEGKQSLHEKYDLLSLFLKSDRNASESDLRDVTMNFIIAGRDTTAQLLSWFSYLLTKNPNVEQKIVDEIHENIGDVEDEDIDYQMVNKCQYLENAFLETLRLHPSVPHLVRYAKTDIPLPNGKHIIRKGDGIIVPTYAMGRMPWLWTDPLIFDPSRFENTSYSPAQYPAFNIPPRLCLGKHVALLEAKIVIIKLMRKYRIVACPNQIVTYEFSVTNQMKNGFKVRLELR